MAGQTQQESLLPSSPLGSLRKQPTAIPPLDRTKIWGQHPSLVWDASHRTLCDPGKQTEPPCLALLLCHPHLEHRVSAPTFLVHTWTVVAPLGVFQFWCIFKALVPAVIFLCFQIVGASAKRKEGAKKFPFFPSVSEWSELELILSCVMFWLGSYFFQVN